MVLIFKPELAEVRKGPNSVTLQIEGKADRTAKGYKFICPVSSRPRISTRQTRYPSINKLEFEGALILPPSTPVLPAGFTVA